MNTQLLEYLVRVTIKDMIIGERAFTVPWAMIVDHEGKCWIRGNHAFTHERSGTSRMQVRRSAQGFEVQVARGERFNQEYISQEAWQRMGLFPVVEINGWESQKYDEVKRPDEMNKLAADDPLPARRGE